MKADELRQRLKEIDGSKEVKFNYSGILKSAEEIEIANRGGEEVVIING